MRRNPPGLDDSLFSLTANPRKVVREENDENDAAHAAAGGPNHKSASDVRAMEREAQRRVKEIERIRKQADMERRRINKQPVKSLHVGGAKKTSKTKTKTKRRRFGGSGSDSDSSSDAGDFFARPKPMPMPMPGRRLGPMNDDDDDDSSSGSETGSSVSSLGSDMPPVAFGAAPRFKPRMSRAEELLEERRLKAARLTRIQQLEGRGIECMIDAKMSTPLVDLDDECARMEMINGRRKKILKGRIALWLSTMGFTRLATSHPGPDALKFTSVRGWDKKVSSEIDEYDDCLERLYDLLFPEDTYGDSHPGLELGLLLGTSLASHVADSLDRRDEAAAAAKQQDGPAQLKTDVMSPEQRQAAIDSGELGNLGGLDMGTVAKLAKMLQSNPDLKAQVENSQPAQQRAQQQPVQQQPAPQQRAPQQQRAPAPPAYQPPSTFPTVTPDPAMVAAHSREVNQLQSELDRMRLKARSAEQRAKQAEEAKKLAAAPEPSEENLRRAMDQLVESADVRAAMREMGDIVDSSDDEGSTRPLVIDTTRRGRGRGRGRGGRGRGGRGGRGSRGGRQ